MNIKNLTWRLMMSAYEYGFNFAVSNLDTSKNTSDKKAKKASEACLETLRTRDEIFAEIEGLLAHIANTEDLTRDEIVEAVVACLAGDK